MAVAQSHFQDLSSQSPVHFLLALGPCTRLPFPCPLVNLLLPFCDPLPGLFSARRSSPVAGTLSERASPTLTLALSFVLSARSFERRATSVPRSPEVRDMCPP